MGKAYRHIIRSLAESTSVWQLHKDLPFFKRVMKIMYLSELLDPVFDLYYSIQLFFNNCKRVIQFAPYAWQHRDWDHGFVLRFNKYLYERLHKGCFVNGHHVINRKEERRLKTVIALHDRLIAEDYSGTRFDLMEEEFGKWDIAFEAIPGSTSSRMVDKRLQRMDEETKKRYERARKNMHDLEEYQHKQDLTMLGEYIAKYSRKWWD